MEAKFELGRTMITPGVEALEIGVQGLLRRHASGDWGDCCPEDVATNESALKHGERLFSVYTVAEDTKVWIITEWDRSVTTILLPEEY